MQHSFSCDVFCKIVDNYGDIGVCWRLSRQLAKEQNASVRLLIDDFVTASHIIPGLLPLANTQIIDGILIEAWEQALNASADVVIENFSCDVPEVYAKRFSEQQKTGKDVVWINLEYLSAEAWVEGCHLLPSQHPSLGYQKTYYYPGFTDKTGGLLREHDLKTQQENWLLNTTQTAFWKSLNIESTTIHQTIKFSLFCYPQADSLALIEALSQHEQAITLFMPMNANSDQSLLINNRFSFDESGHCQFKNLHLQQLPFLSQTQYDQLLYYCDLNFVRGEDSWIRAIWSTKPFIWQPYIQSEDAHIIKLMAFLGQYLKHSTDLAINQLILDAHLWWSNAQKPADQPPWSSIIEKLSDWTSTSQINSTYYYAQPSLTSQLTTWLNKQKLH